ncbi:beta-ketoacyl-ACP synthase III [soil metagenome]
MNYAKIIGIGSYLPEKIYTNADLEKMVDTSDDWIISRTGIRERHIAADHESASTMAGIAAAKALEMAGVNKDEIGLIVVATTTPDRFFPSTACFVQDELGIKGCAAFDVSAACAGFNYAMGVADLFIRSGKIRYALVIGTEVLSRIIDWKDRNTCVLFGDGSGAVLLGASTEPGIYSTHLHADGSYKNLLYTPNGLRVEEKNVARTMMMYGNEVFKVAVTKLNELVEETLAANNFTKADIDWLVPHQANIRIISALAKKLNLPMEKVIVTVEKHGNTSAASIPLALDDAIRTGKIKQGQTLLLEGFGGGFTWGSVLLKY